MSPHVRHSLRHHRLTASKDISAPLSELLSVPLSLPLQCLDHLRRLYRALYRADAERYAFRARYGLEKLLETGSWLDSEPVISESLQLVPQNTTAGISQADSLVR